MMNGTFAWANRLPAAALTAGAQVSGLDVGQLQNDQGNAARAWQTPDGVLTSAAGAWFQADFGASIPLRALVLARSNLTRAATVRFRVSDDPGFATSTYDSGLLPGPMPGFGQVVVVLPVAESAAAALASEDNILLTTEDTAQVIAAETGAIGRYLRCDIEDPGNPDGHVNVPLAFAGPAWTPLRNWGFETAPSVTAEIREVTTRGGQEYPETRARRRAWDVSLPSLAPTEIWGRVMALSVAGLEGGNVLFVPSPLGPEVYREAILGRLLAPTPVTYPQKTNVLRAWRARITERL